MLCQVRLQDRPHIEQRRVVEQNVRGLGRDPVAAGIKPGIAHQVETMVIRLAFPGEAVANVCCQNARAAGRA